MPLTSVARIAGLIGVAANVIAVAEFGSHHEWTYALLGFFVAATLAIPPSSKLLAYYSIRKLLKDAEDTLRKEQIQPDRLIAFDRSSAIYAGMLAQRLGISEVISLPRSARPPQTPLTPRTVVVGERFRIEYDEEYMKKSAIIVFHLRTGATLRAGLEALVPTGAAFPGRILALYASEGGIAHWRDVLYVQHVPQGKVPQDVFPWMSGAYIHM